MFRMPGLIAEYLFNGNANDTSGHGHHGVVHGATPTTDRFGNPNSAFHFDGVDDYIVVDPPLPIDSVALSVSAWMRCDPRHTEGWTNCIIAQDDGNDEDQSRRVFQLSMYMGHLVWHRMVGARDPMCKRRVRPGIWHHVVAVYENGDHRIYMDGGLEDSVSHRFWTNSAQPVHVGRKGTDERGFFFQGDLDDIRIFDRALREEEIRGLFEEGGWRSPVPDSRVEAADPLTGRWGRYGMVVLYLHYDGRNGVNGRIMARDPGYIAPIRTGTFHRSTGALRLEGTARHPDDGSAIPYVIEGKLDDGEIAVTATFTFAASADVHSGNYILTKEGANGSRWKNSAIRWRLRKLLRTISGKRRS
jgi:Concanavalin A-like lectin/glucanases superfamily